VAREKRASPGSKKRQPVQQGGSALQRIEAKEGSNLQPHIQSWFSAQGMNTQALEDISRISNLLATGPFGFHELLTMNDQYRIVTACMWAIVILR